MQDIQKIVYSINGQSFKENHPDADDWTNLLHHLSLYCYKPQRLISEVLQSVTVGDKHVYTVLLSFDNYKLCLSRFRQCSFNLS